MTASYRFYSEEQISPNQAKTPEGFLICHAVPIARTGMQLYGPGEIDIEEGPDGIVRIFREAEEVFRPQTIASFEGKPLCIEHPDGVDITPGNWRELAVGHLQNVRRGEGISDHLLIADFIITHPDAIRLIEDNPVYEVSAGYDAQYMKLGIGQGKQVNILGNHVAFVKRGRCGPVCATKDHETLPTTPQVKNPVTLRSAAGESVYSLPRKTGDKMANGFKDWLGKMKDALTKGDLEGAKSTMDEGAAIMQMTGDPDDNETHTHVHIHTGAPAITKAEGNLPNTGETRVTTAATGSGTDEMFGSKTFDEAFEEHVKKTEDSVSSIRDSFEEFKKEMRDSMAKCMDSIAEMAKAAGTTVDEKMTEMTGEGSAKEEGDKEIEGGLKEEAPPGTGDSIMKARDSAMLEDSFSQTVALAEILVPGIAIPTFDAASDKVSTYKSICALRRRALGTVMATRDGAALVERVAGRTPDIETLPCRDLAPIFRGAAAAKAEQNNAAAARASTQDNSYFGHGYDQPKAGKRPMTIADVAKINEEFNARQAAAAAAK